MTDLAGPLRLDGAEDELIPAIDDRRIALGHDPFDDDAALDPLLDRLGLLGGPFAPERRTTRELLEEIAERPAELTRRRFRGRALRVPHLADIESPPAASLIDRFLGDETRRRLDALEALVSPDVPWDRYGFSPRTLRAAAPAFLAIYRGWFRVRSHGHEHIPPTGPAILVANHGGLLPFDGAMAILDVLLHTDPPRLVRTIVDRWAGALPFVNVFFARVGQVVGTRENFSDLLEDGHVVLVFPEGMEGIRKTVTQRHRLQRFHVGFIEQALQQRAPIIPMAIVGSDDQAPILFDFSSLARRLGLPMLPITPTFPWLGPLGLLPYPVPYRVVYGEPLNFHERFGPDGAEDPRLVRYLANQVRRAVQALIDRTRS